jgi:hypothetical protein
MIRGVALKLAVNRDLVDAGREELGKRREEFAGQLERVVGDVRRIDELTNLADLM